MAECKDKNAILQFANKQLKHLDDGEAYRRVEYWIDNIPTADVVARDCFDKILAENDTMREQLAQIGKKPGDCMDDVKLIPRGEWVRHFTSFHTLWGANCSNCNGWVDSGNTNINRLYRYCPHCGSLNGEGINSDF